MDRRHQVFVSSTFTDLEDERAEIIQALLELDCFPAGMEMFPATHEGAWELIKKVIDDSDYYCLVIGGRYGSTDADGLSFTEREYDYASATGKPLIAFLHASPEKIALEKSERDNATREKLAAFRLKVESNHHCKYWTTAEDLGSKVSRAMVNLRKAHPSDGWVPGAFAEDEGSRIERATLKARVAELEAALKSKQEPNHLDIEDLASGDDIFNATASYRDPSGTDVPVQVPVSWDQILKYVGPTLLAECTDDELEDKIRLCFYHALERMKPGEKIVFDFVIAPYITLDQIKVQLRALGYMIPGVKRRAVSDRKPYWKLTPSGEQRLISVQALKRPLQQESLPLEMEEE